jgi:hypothetical protein
MGGSSDQLNRQIAETRSAMESRIVELRQRGRHQVRRYTRAALIAVAVGAAVGVTAVGVYAVYRYTRPASTRERIRRLVPTVVLDGWRDLSRLRETWELGLRRQIPSVRLYVGERQIGEKPPQPRAERIAIQAAQALGTAAGTALASNLARRVFERVRAA